MTFVLLNKYFVYADGTRIDDYGIDDESYRKIGFLESIASDGECVGEWPNKYNLYEGWFVAEGMYKIMKVKRRL